MPNYLNNILTSLLERDPHNETIRWIADYAHDLDLIDEIPEPEAEFQFASRSELARLTGRPLASGVQNLLNSNTIHGQVFDAQAFQEDLGQKLAITQNINRLILDSSEFRSERVRDRLARYNRHWARELARVQEEFPNARQPQERRVLVSTVEDIEGRIEVTQRVLQQAAQINEALSAESFSQAQHRQVRQELGFAIDQLLVSLGNYGANQADAEGLRASQVADHMLRHLSLLVESHNHLSEFESLDENACDLLWEIFEQSRELLHSDEEDVFARVEELRQSIFRAYSLQAILGELGNLGEQNYGANWARYISQTRSNLAQAIIEQDQELLIQAQTRFQRLRTYHEYQGVLSNISERLEENANSASSADYRLARRHLQRFCAQLLTDGDIEESRDLEEANQALARAARLEPNLLLARGRQYLAAIESNSELEAQARELSGLLEQGEVNPRLEELINEIRPHALSARANLLHEQWERINSLPSISRSADLVFLRFSDSDSILEYSTEELDRLEQATLPLASAIIFTQAYKDERILSLASPTERAAIDEAFANLERVIIGDHPEETIDARFVESLSYLTEILPRLSTLAGSRSFAQRTGDTLESYTRADRSNQARWGRSVRGQFAFLSGRTTERLRELSNNPPEAFNPLGVDSEDLLNPDYTENVGRCRTKEEVFTLLSRVNAMARANQLPERLEDPREQQAFLEAVENHPSMEDIQAEVRVGQDAQDLHAFALHISLIAATALVSEVIAAAVVSEVSLGLNLLRLRSATWMGRTLNLGRFGQTMARVFNTTGRGRGVLIGQPVRRLMERSVMTPIFTASNLWLPGQIGISPEFEFQGNWDVFVVRSTFTFGLFTTVGAAGQSYHRVAGAFLRGGRSLTAAGRFGVNAGWFGTETAVFTGYGLGELAIDASMQGVPSDVIWNDMLTREVVQERAAHAVATLAGLRGAGLVTRPISHSFRARLGRGARNALMRNSSRTRDAVDELNTLVRRASLGERIDQGRYEALREEIVELAQQQVRIHEELHAAGAISDAQLGQVEISTRRVETTEQIRQLRSKQMREGLSEAEEISLVESAQRLIEIEAQQHESLQRFGADPDQVRAARDARLLAQADLELIRAENRLQRQWYEVESEINALNERYNSYGRLPAAEAARYLELTQTEVELAQEYRTLLENNGEQSRIAYVNNRARQNLEGSLEPQILFLRDAIQKSAQRVRDFYEQDLNFASETTPDGVEVINNFSRLREVTELQAQVTSQINRMEFLLAQANERGLINAERAAELRNFLAAVRNRSAQLLNVAHAGSGTPQPAPPAESNVHPQNPGDRAEARTFFHPDGRVSEETVSVDPTERQCVSNLNDTDTAPTWPDYFSATPIGNNLALALARLRPRPDGPISLQIVGAPGTGKTTLTTGITEYLGNSTLVIPSSTVCGEGAIPIYARALINYLKIEDESVRQDLLAVQSYSELFNLLQTYADNRGQNLLFIADEQTPHLMRGHTELLEVAIELGIDHIFVFHTDDSADQADLEQRISEIYPEGQTNILVPETIDLDQLYSELREFSEATGVELGHDAIQILHRLTRANPASIAALLSETQGLYPNRFSISREDILEAASQIRDRHVVDQELRDQLIQTPNPLDSINQQNEALYQQLMPQIQDILDYKAQLDELEFEAEENGELFDWISELSHHESFLSNGGEAEVFLLDTLDPGQQVVARFVSSQDVAQMQSLALARARDVSSRGPNLLYFDEERSIQIIEFIAGVRMDNYASLGRELSINEIDEFTRDLISLGNIGIALDPDGSNFFHTEDGIRWIDIAEYTPEQRVDWGSVFYNIGYRMLGRYRATNNENQEVIRMRSFLMLLQAVQRLDANFLRQFTHDPNMTEVLDWPLYNLSIDQRTEYIDAMSQLGFRIENPDDSSSSSGSSTPPVPPASSGPVAPPATNMFGEALGAPNEAGFSIPEFDGVGFTPTELGAGLMLPANSFVPNWQINPQLGGAITAGSDQHYLPPALDTLLTTISSTTQPNARSPLLVDRANKISLFVRLINNLYQLHSNETRDYTHNIVYILRELYAITEPDSVQHQDILLGNFDLQLTILATTYEQIVNELSFDQLSSLIELSLPDGEYYNNPFELVTANSRHATMPSSTPGGPLYEALLSLQRLDFDVALEQELALVRIENMHRLRNQDNENDLADIYISSRLTGSRIYSLDYDYGENDIIIRILDPWSRSIHAQARLYVRRNSQLGMDTVWIDEQDDATVLAETLESLGRELLKIHLESEIGY